MIQQLMTYAALILNAVIFVRLFTFKRQGTRYRPVVSLLAALTMGFAGSSALFFIQGRIVMTIDQWPLMLLLLMIALAVCKSQGNFAILMDPLMPGPRDPRNRWRTGMKERRK